MKVIKSVNYSEAPLFGRISISKILGKNPIEYKMVLLRNHITIDTKCFPTAEKAIGYASLKGFNTHKWEHIL